jgi:sialic acid synthase SpsE
MVDVIAEIGWNHMGDMRLAEKMIRAAANVGADYVKFQTWSTTQLKPGSWDTDGRRQIYTAAELSLEKHLQLKKLCGDAGVKFLTSVFSHRLVSMVRESVECDSIKIPSSELSNERLLRRINELFAGCDVFMSTGAHSLREIETAKAMLHDCNTTMLHCVSAYPCPVEKANLHRIETLRKAFGGKVGYSGHCLGINDALFAIAKWGASIVEKHFTIDQDLPGRDNKFAILPHELKLLCNFSHSVEAFDVSSDPETYQDCENDTREFYRGRWDKEI